ncbi:hypothetical protein ROS1_31050 [Roseibium sp. ROS1]
MFSSVNKLLDASWSSCEGLMDPPNWLLLEYHTEAAAEPKISIGRRQQRQSKEEFGVKRGRE